MPVPVAAVIAASSRAKKIGDVIGGLFGGRKRSMCDTVAPEDVPDFIAGKIAQYKVWKTRSMIAIGFGMPANSSFEDIGFTFEEVALIHLDQWVPRCRSLEGDRLTSNPSSTGSQEFISYARKKFEGDIAIGRFVSRRQIPTRRMDGGDMPSIPGAPPDSAGSVVPAAQVIPGVQLPGLDSPEVKNAVAGVPGGLLGIGVAALATVLFLRR